MSCSHGIVRWQSGRRHKLQQCHHRRICQFHHRNHYAASQHTQVQTPNSESRHTAIDSRMWHKCAECHESPVVGSAYSRQSRHYGEDKRPYGKGQRGRRCRARQGLLPRCPGDDLYSTRPRERFCSLRLRIAC